MSSSKKTKPVVQVKKLPAISQLKKPAPKPSLPEEKFRVSDQDLKWYDAYCALRNNAYSIACTLNGIASQLREAATGDRRVWNAKAMQTLALSAADQLTAIQDSNTDLFSSLEEYIGKDLFRNCGITYSEREQAPIDEARVKYNKHMLEHYAKACGVKICKCGDKCTCHKEKK